MAKHDVLTEEEFANYQPPKKAVRQLEKYSAARGLPPGQIKVLDWGCGRGRFVLWLREQGYEAYGVDIDLEPVQNGLPLFAAKGHNGNYLRVLETDGKTNFENGFFDFVMTDNVLEHVSDLEKVVAEISRVTSSKGAGYHIFPAQRQLLEGHLFMPFVHWLPKNSLRKTLIRHYIKNGREPHWKEVEDATPEKKTDVYYQYSINHLFYRSFSQIQKSFKEAGFRVKTLSLQNPAVQGHKILGPLTRIRVVRPFIQWLVTTFKQVELLSMRN